MNDLDKRQQAYKYYQQGMKYKDIANKLQINLSTVKSWAVRYWKQSKQPQKIEICCGPPLRNKNAFKHGLRSKYPSDETIELAKKLNALSPVEILWQNIALAYAAIIRSQKIMHVKDDSDYTKRVVSMNAYTYKEAFEKQALFLNAQSKAINILCRLINLYEHMKANQYVYEEKLLQIKLMKANLDKINKAIVENVFIEDIPKPNNATI